MLLEGSCHCQKVRFRVSSRQPWPYQLCYCSICRKTGGGGGYLINLGADASTLEVEGRNHLGIYRARIERDGKWVLSKHRRFFCRECGSHLWASHERWPDLVHPVAGAVDTPLPVPPSRVHMMVGSKANWVSDPPEHEECFAEYPAESLADWHAHNGYRDRDA